MSVVLLVSGILITVYGMLVLCIIGMGHWSNFLLPSAGLILALLGKLWPERIRPHRALKLFITVFLAVCLLIFLFFEIRIIGFGHSVPAADADWVVVLGAKVNESGPSVEFSARIDACAEYLSAHPQARAVVSGGQGADEPVPEAAAAKKRLMARGIAGERILTEEQSTSTEENLRFSAEVIRSAGGDPAVDPVVIVSSSFHLYRAGLFAKDAGYGSVSFLGSSGLLFLVPYYYFREFAACVREAVF